MIEVKRTVHLLGQKCSSYLKAAFYYDRYSFNRLQLNWNALFHISIHLYLHHFFKMRLAAIADNIPEVPFQLSSLDA